MKTKLKATWYFYTGNDSFSQQVEWKFSGLNGKNIGQIVVLKTVPLSHRDWTIICELQAQNVVQKCQVFLTKDQNTQIRCRGVSNNSDNFCGN